MHPIALVQKINHRDVTIILTTVYHYHSNKYKISIKKLKKLNDNNQVRILSRSSSEQRVYAVKTHSYIVQTQLFLDKPYTWWNTHKDMPKRHTASFLLLQFY